jgi:hypothetical protein
LRIFVMSSHGYVPPFAALIAQPSKHIVIRYYRPRDPLSTGQYDRAWSVS